MFEQDLELGLLPLKSVTTDSEEFTDIDSPLKSSWHPSKSSHTATASDEAEKPHDVPMESPRITSGMSEQHDSMAHEEYIYGVPRRKVERLMKMWIEVLHQSMEVDYMQERSETERMDSSKLDHGRKPVVLSSLQLPSEYRPPASWNVRGHQPEGYATSGQFHEAIRGNLEVLSDNDIQAESDRRKSVQDEWRTSEDYTHLEDCWKHLWEPKDEVATGLFQWSCSDEMRRALQADLVDAMNANSSILIVELYMRRDLRAVAPWISLIGLRLNDLYRSTYSSQAITPMQQIQVLIECIWCCNSFNTNLKDVKSAQSPCIGDVLLDCYRRRILHQPLGGVILREHYLYVRNALYLINTLFKHSPPRLNRLESLETTWNTSIVIAEADMRELPSSTELEKGKDSFFRIDDFNIGDLQSLGHLQLQWTPYWDEHLLLETSATANIIKVYFFQPSLTQYLIEK